MNEAFFLILVLVALDQQKATLTPNPTESEITISKLSEQGLNEYFKVQ